MMRLADKLMEICSILLYPMLMPMYGMVLFCCAAGEKYPEISLAYWLVSMGGTLILTLVVPFLLLVFMRHKGYIDSLHISDSKQRTMPYIYTLVCYVFWGYFLHMVLKLPPFMLLIAVGAIIALLSVTVINYWWKISAHMTGIGGLFGGICSYGLYYSTLPLYVVMVVLVLVLLLMYARIHQKAHSPMQVVCGFLLGLLSTFIPNWIVYHA